MFEAYIFLLRGAPKTHQSSNFSQIQEGSNHPMGVNKIAFSAFCDILFWRLLLQNHEEIFKNSLTSCEQVIHKIGTSNDQRCWTSLEQITKRHKIVMNNSRTICEKVMNKFWTSSKHDFKNFMNKWWTT